MIAQGYIDNSILNKELIFNGIIQTPNRANNCQPSVSTLPSSSAFIKPRPSISYAEPRQFASIQPQLPTTYGKQRQFAPIQPKPPKTYGEQRQYGNIQLKPSTSYARPGIFTNI